MILYRSYLIWLKYSQSNNRSNPEGIPIRTESYYSLKVHTVHKQLVACARIDSSSWAGPRKRL